HPAWAVGMGLGEAAGAQAHASCSAGCSLPCVPQRYTATPHPPGILPQQLKCLLLAVVVVLIHVVVIVAFLLLGLHITETHTETVLQMTTHGLGGEGPPQHLSMSQRERTGTLAVPDGLNASAMVVYDYSKLLVGYRSWRHRACYVTRLDRDSIPGLDSVTDTFRRRQAELQGTGGNATPLADRSILGTTMNILCSTVPVYWA
ncbi:PSPC protein, partial [Tricholaema leucomelas]|nr:PSPC protein [Tricholaema leucomelas]